ncbi:DUF3040 domain-containing protein [Ornithinimicrobium cerasi]|uniref:DUF3040 domain-containing protein n=1 Tax=Ornithinimicrobium cerasi TaxID=2248773 RepID=A0A285VC36_9MICO|nr:DUF3040 domain-containing protein [Ornithinimicrobium cerasi]SOC51620.1 Protein of unknown function [Ornithinimicrobium cerasi]
MPLSEHEQRVLEQMEQALYAEDPRLASTLKSTASGGAAVERRRLVIGVLVALGGLALVLVGVMTQMIWIGAVGFLAMVLGGAWAATPGRHGRPRLGVVGADGQPRRSGPSGGAGGGGGTGPRRPRRPSSGGGAGGFMQRMEQQWDRRKEQGPS